MELFKIIEKRIKKLEELRDSLVSIGVFDKVSEYTGKIDLLESILAEWYDN